MNQALSISITKFCLLHSKVVVSLQRALLADALGETSSLYKPPHHVKVGFIEGVLTAYVMTVWSISYNQLVERARTLVLLLMSIIINQKTEVILKLVVLITWFPYFFISFLTEIYLHSIYLSQDKLKDSRQEGDHQKISFSINEHSPKRSPSVASI